MSIPYSDLVQIGTDPFADGGMAGLGDLQQLGQQELPAAQALVNSTYNAIISAAGQISSMHGTAASQGSGPAAASLVDDLQLLASEATRLRQRAESIRQFDASFVNQAVGPNVHGNWAYGSEVDGPKLYPWNKWQIYKAAGEALQGIQGQIGQLLGQARGKRDQIASIAAEYQAQLQQQQAAQQQQQEQRAIQQQVTDAVTQRELDRIESERVREEEAELRRQQLEDQRLQLELDRMQASQEAQIRQQEAQQRLLDMQAQAEERRLQAMLDQEIAAQAAEQARLEQQLRQQQQEMQLANQLSTQYTEPSAPNFVYTDPLPTERPPARGMPSQGPVAYGSDYQRDWYVDPFVADRQAPTAPTYGTELQAPPVQQQTYYGYEPPQTYQPAPQPESWGFDPGYVEMFGLSGLGALTASGYPIPEAPSDLWADSTGAASDPWADSTGFAENTAVTKGKLDPSGRMATSDSSPFRPEPADTGPGVADVVGGVFSSLAQVVQSVGPALTGQYQPAPAPAPAPKSNMLPVALGVGALGVLGYFALKK